MAAKKNHTDKLAHQRISDHETLCRIMQKQTQKQLDNLKKQIERLEKIVISCAAFIIIGLFSLLLAILKYHL